MRAYFAYSSALDRQAFDQWKMQHGYAGFSLPEGKRATASGVALTFDFPSRFWNGRVLGLTESAAQSVEGILFMIPEEQWPIIQHKEGVVTGSSVEMDVTVNCGGENIDATAFVTHPTRRSAQGPVSEPFLEAIRRAYRTWGLSEDALTQAAQS